MSRAEDVRLATIQASLLWMATKIWSDIRWQEARSHQVGSDSVLLGENLHEYVFSRSVRLVTRSKQKRLIGASWGLYCMISGWLDVAEWAIGNNSDMVKSDAKPLL